MEGGRLHPARSRHGEAGTCRQGEALGHGWNSCDDQHVCVGNIDTVEVWQEESRSGEEAEERLLEGQKYLGAVAGTRASVCLV